VNAFEPGKNSGRVADAAEDAACAWINQQAWTSCLIRSKKGHGMIEALSLAGRRDHDRQVRQGGVLREPTFGKVR